MAIALNTPKTHLGPESVHRIQRHLDGLERRLAKFPTANVQVTVKDRPTERRFTVDVLTALGVDGVELVSHQTGESAEQAAKLAVEDIERQLERYVSTLRGEAAYGTPSRREPKDLRPANISDEDDFDAPPDLDFETGED